MAIIQLPIDGAGCSQLFGGGDNALDKLDTSRLQLGQMVDIYHSATGASLTYVLLAGAAPSTDVFAVAPDNYNVATNDVHWRLAAPRHSGAPLLQNPDIDGGNGGFNIQQAASDVNPELVLDAALVIFYSAFN